MEGKKLFGTKSVKKAGKGKLKKHSAECNKEAERMAMIKELMSKTDLDQDAVVVAEKEFLINYPSGGVTKEEFVELSSLGFITESVYRAFDKVKLRMDYIELLEVVTSIRKTKDFWTSSNICWPQKSRLRAMTTNWTGCSRRLMWIMEEPSAALR